jgi:hypothetical protein
MGRSVSYPTSSLVCFTVLETEDSDSFGFEFEWFCEDAAERACAAFPSLYAHEGWRGREDRILLRNAFADFGVSEYCGLIAVWIVERDDDAYWDADARACRSPRAQRWLAQIAPKFDALFGAHDCIGRFSNGEAIYRKRNPAAVQSGSPVL